MSYVYILCVCVCTMLGKDDNEWCELCCEGGKGNIAVKWWGTTGDGTQQTQIWGEAQGATPHMWLVRV